MKKVCYMTRLQIARADAELEALYAVRGIPHMVQGVAAFPHTGCTGQSIMYIATR